jgi:hypothetical protein
VEPLIGAKSGRTRVVCSHNPEADLDEADLVLGLRSGRPAMLANPAALTGTAIKDLYG